MELPRIISVDDHVLEPPDLWTSRLPARWRDVAPRVVQTKTLLRGWGGTDWDVEIDSDDPGAKLADMWVFEDMRQLVTMGMAAVGYSNEERIGGALTYEAGMRRGCWDRDARLADMDVNHTEASLCFPSIPKFCGQTFLRAKDKDLALACVQAYNDWMIEDWCGGPARGRLIPVTLVPLWDVELAAAEVRRCADKGAHAVSFTECPSNLGLPSLYSHEWDPFVAACEEADTVVNMHIGSSSAVAKSAPDSPHIVSAALFFQYGMYAVIDWIMSATLARFPDQRIALSEAQAGWMPFVLERLDKAWHRKEPIDVNPELTQPPSEYAKGRIFSCIFDDLHGLESRDLLGIEHMMFETDYPHADSTWPYSRATAEKLIADAGLDDTEARLFVRDNAIRCYGLDRYFGVQP